MCSLGHRVTLGDSLRKAPGIVSVFDGGLRRPCVTRVSWQVADLTLVDGPLRVGDWFRPAEVAVEGGEVRYRLAAREDLGGHVLWRVGAVAERSEGMLSSFVGLATASDAKFRRQVIAFARRWGVLGLCRHGLPVRHPISPEMLPLAELCDRWVRTGGAEPVRLWREYARQAGAVLNLAAALAVGATGEATDWEIALRPFPPGPPAVTHPRQGDPAPEMAALLDRAVAHWTMNAGVVVAPDSRTPGAIRLGVRDAFGAIAVQLLFASARAPVEFRCSGCGEKFQPSRRPRAGENSWCPACRAAGKDTRSASRRYAARKRESRGRSGQDREAPPDRHTGVDVRLLQLAEEGDDRHR